MAGEWITLPVGEVADVSVTPAEPAEPAAPDDTEISGKEKMKIGAIAGYSYQCKLCKARVPSLPENEAVEQILNHLQRTHGGVTDTEGKKMPARARAKLIALGWTPPPDVPIPEREPNPAH